MCVAGVRPLLNGRADATAAAVNSNECKRCCQWRQMGAGLGWEWSGDGMRPLDEVASPAPLPNTCLCWAGGG